MEIPASRQAWTTLTSLRATRSNIRKVDLDHDHGGIVKLNPLADWTHDDVWAYAREYDVPSHPLYERGFTNFNLGGASALSVLMFGGVLSLFVAYGIVNKSLGRREEAA